MKTNIVEITAIYFDLEESKIKGKGRKRKYVYARQHISAYLRLLNVTFENISKILNKDHSTIIHYCKQHQNLIETDEFYSDNYDLFVKTINKKIKVIHENKANKIYQNNYFQYMSNITY